MPRKLIIERPRCEKCDGTGRVPSRLPFRDKPCEWCGGKGIKDAEADDREDWQAAQAVAVVGSLGGGDGF